MAADTAAQATNRGFISAAKEYQAGEELTFDYGLLNDAVLAFYGAPSPCPLSHAPPPLAVASSGSRARAGIPTPDCRGLRR